ncbi:uncharacterized protein LOC120132620 [Hibiscus syriacus]|uniref:uncharacterized protein LOC120132620 n=1 Tax=Hibiscus syriacus TaxID=106335 RepID=UPI00192171A5|nr:uncharacterized protein LOC120132620 [Hibiscus syriacus]
MASVKIKCMACKHELQGSLVYACLPCYFFLHDSCINVMPRQVQSPFHPQHTLLAGAIRLSYFHTCYACEETVQGICFFCDECDVSLHLSCAKYHTRAIKHIFHPHPLLYMGKTIAAEISCHACLRKDPRDSFRCTECDFRIHVECISIPTRVEHPRHLHSLVLINSFIEDESGDYCCDICETERNSEHHVYYCEECSFIAHIYCVAPEFGHTEKMLMDQMQIEEKSNESLESEMMSVDHGKMVQIDFFHPHPLMLNDEAGAMFVCNGCGELSRGSSYNCSLCWFSLDAKCAALKLDDDVAKHDAEKAKQIKTTISHFGHTHQLTRCKIEALQTELNGEYCKACRNGIGGSMYVCLFCEICFHESCLLDMPSQVHSPFHPHPLLLYVSDNTKGGCHVCGNDVGAITLICFHCRIGMHPSCAMYQTQTPSSAASRVNSTYISSVLPYIVKHVRHSHPLTLSKSVVEDDSENYYCDTCETKRNPELDVYYCKECNYIAHIDCVLSEAVKSKGNSEQRLMECMLKELTLAQFEHTTEMSMDQLRIEEKSTESLESERISMDDGKMIQNDFFHPHPLILKDEEEMCLCVTVVENCAVVLLTIVAYVRSALMPDVLL